MLKEGDRVRIVRSSVCDNLGRTGTVTYVFEPDNSWANVKWDVDIWATKEFSGDQWVQYLTPVCSIETGRLRRLP